MKKYFTCLTVFVCLLTFFNHFLSAEHVHKEKFLLITGCGRSGTNFMAAFLQKSGLDIGHEKMRKDGAVSWLLAAKVQWAPWGPLYKDFKFQHVFHQVRDPVKVIQSLYNSPPLATWKWIASSIPEMNLDDSSLTLGAKYWIYWNRKAEKKAEWTYRIEDIDEDYLTMSKLLDYPLSADVLKSISKKTNTRGKPKRVITWQILKDELDEDLFELLTKTALKYGYTPDIF